MFGDVRVLGGAEELPPLGRGDAGVVRLKRLFGEGGCLGHVPGSLFDLRCGRAGADGAAVECRVVGLDLGAHLQCTCHGAQDDRQVVGNGGLVGLVVLEGVVGEHLEVEAARLVGDPGPADLASSLTTGT